MTAQNRCLIIFTRYPVAGKTKTRLIPVLGAEGAADLQREMTTHTVCTARALADTEIHVQFCGGDETALRNWLGKGIKYSPQHGTDLGARMANAVARCLDSETTKAVVVGSDCPGITPALLDQAFVELDGNDVVLGPSTDGGYYLVGLTRSHPPLFEGIEWGTRGVLAQTLEAAKRERLSLHQLRELTDVDTEADLPVWETVKARRISVIIPALNEDQQIASAIASARNGGSEVIVADGGSSDKTVDIAVDAGVPVVTDTGGRARQMNAGAKIATGTILLFLHADTRLPNDYRAHVCRAMEDSRNIAGAFGIHIDGSGSSFRVLEWGINTRSRLRGLPYGDQALFMRKDTFRELGGFPEVPIMEDYEFIRQLRKLGRVVMVPNRVTTSSRRWARKGIMRATLINQLMIAGYNLGIERKALARLYRSRRKVTSYGYTK